MTTIVTVLSESVAAGREIKGTIVKMVPDNKKFELIDFDIESGKFTFQEMLEEGDEKTPEVIVVTEDNALVNSKILKGITTQII